MGKTSTIPGRAAKKSTSSISRASASAPHSKNNEAIVKKAIKLETKRNSIQRKTQDSNPTSNSTNRHSVSSINNKGTDFGPGWVNTLPPTNLSKSSLRRLKRKGREQLAGNREGMKDIEQAIDLVQEGEDEREEESMQDDKEGTVGGGPNKSSKVGAKKRKQVLSQELLRQPSILKDPSFSSNPFQALRQHARNTLTFDGPVEKLKPGRKQDQQDPDQVEM